MSCRNYRRGLFSIRSSFLQVFVLKANNWFHKEYLKHKNWDGLFISYFRVSLVSKPFQYHPIITARGWQEVQYLQIFLKHPQGTWLPAQHWGYSAERAKSLKVTYSWETCSYFFRMTKTVFLLSCDQKRQFSKAFAVTPIKTTMVVKMPSDCHWWSEG